MISFLNDIFYYCKFFLDQFVMVLVLRLYFRSELILKIGCDIMFKIFKVYFY